jgi:hypothetical protein
MKHLMMNMKTEASMLLVTRAERELPHTLIDRAALIARKLELNVIVFCPMVTAMPAESGNSASATGSGADKALHLAQQHAEKVAEALRGRLIQAEASARLCTSEVEAVMALVDVAGVSLLVTPGDLYRDWEESLTQSRLLERIEIPVWVQNDGKFAGPVFGALAITQDEDDAVVGDDDIARQVREVADKLEESAHLMHAIPRESALWQAFEYLTPPDESANTAPQRIEAARARLAHEIADRWQIQHEHVHLNHAGFTEEVERLSESMHASLFVVGSRHRSALVRLLSQSRQRRLLDTQNADLLILSNTD